MPFPQESRMPPDPPGFGPSLPAVSIANSRRPALRRAAAKPPSPVRLNRRPRGRQACKYRNPRCHLSVNVTPPWQAASGVSREPAVTSSVRRRGSAGAPSGASEPLHLPQEQDLAGVARLVVQPVDDRGADRAVAIAGYRGVQQVLGRIADRLTQPPLLGVEAGCDRVERRPPARRDG